MTALEPEPENLTMSILKDLLALTAIFSPLLAALAFGG